MYAEISGPSDSPAREHPRAIVTIALGAQYLARWRAHARAGFQTYAARHGYDALLIHGHLDRSWRALKRSAAWQKCLILSQPWSQAYERIVWIDADCVLKAGAPDICEGVPAECVGANSVFEQFSDVEFEILVERQYGFKAATRDARAAFAAVQAEVYRTDGLADPPETMMHTGVLVLSPAHHRGLLEAAYAYESANRWYEQTALSYLSLKAGLRRGFSPRFNWLLDLVLQQDMPVLDQARTAAALAARDPYLCGTIRAQWDKCHFLHLGERVWRAIGDASGPESACLAELLAGE
jgi:hypothetical protein